MADQNINHFSQYAENPFEKYAHPEKPDPRDSQSDFMTGLKDTFKQLPELGWGIAAITASGIESIAGEGGIASAAKNFSVNKYKGWQDEIAATHKDAYDFDKAYEKAKEGDFGSLVDFLQYGVGYAVGQGAQVLATAGVGKVIGQLALRPAVESMAAGLVAKQAAKIAGEGASAKAISAATPAAIKSIAGTMGQHAAMAAYSFGMEGGEIGGDLAQKSVNENRALSGNELMRGLGATFLAGTMEYGENVLSLAGMKGKIPSPFGATAGIGGRLGRAATGALVAAPVEGVTEYGQTIAEEYGKGNEQTLDPFAISDATHRQGINAAALGVIGGTVHAGGGGILSSPAAATPPLLQLPHLPDRPLIVFPDGSVATQQQAEQERADGFKHAASPVVQAPDVDSAIMAAQDSIKIPVGSFGEMSDFADLIKRESEYISRRRQSISDEAEPNAFRAQEDADLAYLRRDAQEKSRIDADYSRAERQRRDVDIPKAIDQTVDSANALTQAQGFGESTATPMQIAMERARRVAAERELLSQQKANYSAQNIANENLAPAAVASADPVAQPIKEIHASADVKASPALSALLGKYAEAKASGDNTSMRAMAPKINELTGKSAVAQRSHAVAPLSIGASPNSTEPITVKNGIVYIGKYPAQNFDSGEDVIVPDDATPIQIRDALKSAGAIGGHQKIFGLSHAAKKPGGENRNAIDPSADSLFMAIAKLGGVGTTELTSNGIDSKDITREVAGSVSKKTGSLGKSKRVPISLGFGMPLHKKSGMSFDGVLEQLKQYGYFPDSATKNDVINAFNKELSGDHHYTPAAHEKMAELNAAEYDAHMRAEQDRIDAEIAADQAAREEIGYDEMSYAEQNAVDVLGDFDIDAPGAAQDEAAAMRATGFFSEEEINDELRRNEESASAHAGRAEGQAQGNIPEGDASGSGESFGLTGQTAAEVKEQEANRKAVESKKAPEENAPIASVDQVDLFNTQGGLFNSNRDAERVKEFVTVGAVAQAKATLDAAGVTGTDRTSTIAAVRRGDLTAEDVAEAHPVANEAPSEPANFTAEEAKETYPVKENRKSAVSQIPTRLNEKKLRILELEAAHETEMFYDKYPWASRKTAEEYAAMWSISARDQMRDIANTSRELAVMEDTGIVPSGDLDFLDPMPLSEAIAYSKQRIVDAKKRMEDYRQKAIDAIDEWNKYVKDNPEAARAAGIEVNLDAENVTDNGVAMFSRGIINPMANSNDVVGNQVGRSADDTTPSTVKDISVAWGALGIKNAISEKNGTIELSRLEVPAKDRNSGVGTKAMQQLLDYADSTGQRITLTPSSDFGGIKGRLIDFYKGMGFKENKGRRRDFTTRDTMIREPKPNESTAPGSVGAFSRGKDRAQSKHGDAHSAESLTSALSGLFGGKWLVRLLKSEKFRIVTADEAAEISGDATKDERGNPLAFYHPDGVTYLIADNIPKTATTKQLEGLMRHELGVHALNAGRDSAGWHKIIKQIDVMRQAGNPAVRAAWKRAEDAGTAPQNMLEETAGYLAEEGNTSIARRIIAWFKEAVYKLTGHQIQLTDGDVVAMAQSALRSAPEKLAMGGRQPSGNAIFSNAKSDESFVSELSPEGGLNALFSRSKIIGQTTRQHTPAQLQAMKNVGFQIEIPTLKERAKELWKDAGKKLAQGLVDQFSPVKEISKEAYGLLRLSKGASGAFESLLKGGQLKLTENVYAFDDTKRGGVIDKLLIPLGGEHHDFFRWVAANRAERLKGDDKEHLFSEDDIKALKTLSDGTSEFDYTIQNGANAGKVTRDRTLIYGDALITFNTFNKNVLDMAEQSGLIDKDSRHLWENEFYVPFYREADDKDGGVRGMNIKGGVVRQEAFKKLKGGTDKLNADLLDNTLMNWAHLLDASAKNRAATATLKAMEGMGSAQRVAGSFEEYNASNGAMLQPGTKQTVWFMESGEKAEYKVDDPYLMAAISSLEYAGMRGGIMDVMSKFKHALTFGVTASPFFKVRNLIRDSVQVIGTSPISANVAQNISEGWKLTDPKSDAYFNLLASGGTIHFGTMMEGSEAKRVQSLVESGVDNATILGDDHKVKAFFRKCKSAYNELGNRGEAINRAALYDQLIKQGVGHAEASLMARDLMDFSMQGSFATIRFLTQVVPFFNARMQGLYKLGRAAKEDPARFSAVIGASALASISLLVAFSDDDDWKKREDWDRNNFWWFKFGGTAFRIPKPFEIGAIATLAERGFEYAFDKEMTGERFRKQVVALLGDNLAMNPVPQFAKPIIDLYANKDGLTGSPIESMGMEKLKSEYRFNERTSMTARAASTAMNSVTGMIGVDSPSPVKVDHLLRGYFGWLGTFVVGAGDIIARPAMSQPSQPSRDMWKLMTGNMISDTKDAPSRYVSQMYEQAKEIEQAYGTYKSLVKQGHTADAADFLTDNKDKIQKYKTIEHIKQGEAKINERIKIIERSNIDPDQKRDLIRSLKNQKDLLARRAA